MYFVFRTAPAIPSYRLLIRRIGRPRPPRSRVSRDPDRPSRRADPPAGVWRSRREWQATTRTWPLYRLPYRLSGRVEPFRRRRRSVPGLGVNMLGVLRTTLRSGLRRSTDYAARIYDLGGDGLGGDVLEQHYPVILDYGTWPLDVLAWSAVLLASRKSCCLSSNVATSAEADAARAASTAREASGGGAA